VRFDFFFFFKIEGDFFYQCVTFFFLLSPSCYWKNTANIRITTSAQRKRGVLGWKEENFLIPLSIFQTALIIVLLYIVVCALSIYSTFPSKIWRFAFNIEKKEIFKTVGGAWQAHE
jgi:hypothetical protein